jgi:Protein of unknown function (DUF1091)
VKTNIFRIDGQKKQLLVSLPKVNYCDFRRGIPNRMVLFQAFLEKLYKFGNLSHPCPFRKGYYYMRDVVIDDSNMPGFLKFKSGKMLFQAITADESSVRSKSWLATTEFYVIFTA